MKDFMSQWIRAPMDMLGQRDSSRTNLILTVSYSFLQLLTTALFVARVNSACSIMQYISLEHMPGTKVQAPDSSLKVFDMEAETTVLVLCRMILLSKFIYGLMRQVGG